MAVGDMRFWVSTGALEDLADGGSGLGPATTLFQVSSDGVVDPVIGGTCLRPATTTTSPSTS